MSNPEIKTADCDENKIQENRCSQCIEENERLRLRCERLQDENEQLKSTAELIDELLAWKNQRIEELEKHIDEVKP